MRSRQAGHAGLMPDCFLDPHQSRVILLIVTSTCLVACLAALVVAMARSMNEMAVVQEDRRRERI